MKAGEAKAIAPLDPFHLLWIFALCSVGGLLVETIVSYPIDGVWKDRAGLVWGPFSPIYGLAGVLATVGLARFRDAHGFAIFAASAMAGGLFEFAAGWFWESAFGIVAWSYADQPFNVGGYTCLGISLVWGLAGLVWIRALLSLVMKASDIVPVRMRSAASVVFAAFLAIDIAFTLAAFDCWFERQAGEPVVSPVQVFFAENFDDGFMEGRFQTMSIYSALSARNVP